MLLYSNSTISDSNCHHIKRVDKLFFQKHEKSEVYFTPTEKRIYEAYIARATTKEIRESF